MPITSNDITFKDIQLLSQYRVPALPPASYSVAAVASNVNEDSSLTFNVTGSNIVNRTYYWRINNVTTSTLDFVEIAGSVNVANNTGLFSVNVIADTTITTSEGPESFTVSLREGTTSGTVLSTSSPITVNDTSNTIVGAYGRLSELKRIRTLNTTDYAQNKPFCFEGWYKFNSRASYAGDMFARPDYSYFFITFFSNGFPGLVVNESAGYYGGVDGLLLPRTMTAAGIFSNSISYPLKYNSQFIGFYLNGYLVEYITKASLPASYQFVSATSDLPQHLWGRVNSGMSPGSVFDYRFANCLVYTGNFTPPNKLLSLGGNASVYPSTVNVNTTFAAANTKFSFQSFRNTGPYYFDADTTKIPRTDYGFGPSGADMSDPWVNGIVGQLIPRPF
jgi:hypothetical protein